MIGPMLLLCLLPGCSAPGEAATRRQRTVESAGGTVALGIGAQPYKVTTVAQPGSIAGSITMRGQPAGVAIDGGANGGGAANGDGAVNGNSDGNGAANGNGGGNGVASGNGAPNSRDAKACGQDAASQPAANGGVANVLIWVEGISNGKPLPEVRRETLAIQGCHFSPRVMAVTTGTTINVFSQVRAVLTSRFYREKGDSAIEVIRTVDAGQVVPSERIARKPGIVEVKSQEPWDRAYIAVFDHPYYAVTDAAGRFTIEGLPPGTYTAKLWHEQMGQPTEQRIVVAPGGASRLDFALNVK
jgi:hypothetical protein